MFEELSSCKSDRVELVCISLSFEIMGSTRSLYFTVFMESEIFEKVWIIDFLSPLFLSDVEAL